MSKGHKRTLRVGMKLAASRPGLIQPNQYWTRSPFICEIMAIQTEPLIDNLKEAFGSIVPMDLGVRRFRGKERVGVCMFQVDDPFDDTFHVPVIFRYESDAADFILRFGDDYRILDDKLNVITDGPH